METKDLTVELLKQVREETRRQGDRIDETNSRLDETNSRLDETNSRLDETNSRLDQMRNDLGRRIVESEMRTATAITDLTGTVREFITVIQDDLR